MAPLPNVDHLPHLDPQMRASGPHRETLRPAHVLLPPHRPVTGPQQAEGRRGRGQNRGPRAGQVPMMALDTIFPIKIIGTS